MAHKEEKDEGRSYEQSEPPSKRDECIDIDKELESEPLIIEVNFDTKVFSSDFHVAYRAGNFGLKRGKIDLTLARRWSLTHLLVVSVIWGLSIVVLLLMNYDDYHAYWQDRTLSSTFTACLVLCGLTGLVMSCCSLYFVRNLATLNRPLFLLLLVRLLALLECILLVFALVATLFVIANGNDGTFRVLCVFLVNLMIIDWITAMMWLFHWWRCIDCFERFKSLAIFQPGEPLADGVSDPRNGIISECAYLCWRVYNTDCGTII